MPNLKTHALFDSRDGDRLINLKGIEGKNPDAKTAAVDILGDRGFYRAGDYTVIEHAWEASLEDFADDLGGRDWQLKPGAEDRCTISTVTVGPADFNKG